MYVFLILYAIILFIHGAWCFVTHQDVFEYYYYYYYYCLFYASGRSLPK